MGFFRKKKNNEIYERNTIIAELETKIESLTEQVEKLTVENSELRVQIANLQATNEAIQNENFQLSKNDDDGDDEEDDHLRKLRKKIDEDRQVAFDLKQTAMQEYALELKRVKLFAQKWQGVYSGGSALEKQELSNLLIDILRDDKSVDFVLKAKEKADQVYEFLGGDFQPEQLIKEALNEEENGFNIDDAINPKGELNLEDLCKELGVFNGE